MRKRHDLEREIPSLIEKPTNIIEERERVSV